MRRSVLRRRMGEIQREINAMKKIVERLDRELSEALGISKTPHVSGNSIREA